MITAGQFTLGAGATNFRPGYLALTPDGKRLYVNGNATVNSGAPNYYYIYEIDATTNTIVGQAIPTEFMSPAGTSIAVRGMAVSADGKALYSAGAQGRLFRLFI